MQHVRLSELVIQTSNRPMGIFSHQGLCEHAVVITDVRLLHVADANRRSAYPRVVSRQALGRRLHCGVCKKLGATALMLDHPETPEAVIVLCRLCCGLFSVEQHPEAKLIMLEQF
jgi:snRNA-activating protein complex subunit 3